MQLKTIGQFSLLVVAGAMSVWGADTDPAFREAKQTFQNEIRKKAPADRVGAIKVFAEFSKPETADLIVKRLVSETDTEVRQAAQAALRKLVVDTAVRDALLAEFKRAVRKAVIDASAAEALRPLAIVEDVEFQTAVLKVLDTWHRRRETLPCRSR